LYDFAEPSNIEHLYIAFDGVPNKGKMME